MGSSRNSKKVGVTKVEKDAITCFANSNESKYGFLSSFSKCKITYGGLEYSSVEALFQSFKTNDIEEKKRLFAGDRSAVDAKRNGGRNGALQGKLPDGWDPEKAMYDAVFAKFSQNDDLARKLLATGDRQLVNGTNDGEYRKDRDTIWGVDLGDKVSDGYYVGNNTYGRICMQVRKDIEETIKTPKRDLSEEVKIEGYETGGAVDICDESEHTDFVINDPNDVTGPDNPWD